MHSYSCLGLWWWRTLTTDQSGLLKHNNVSCIYDCIRVRHFIRCLGEGLLRCINGVHTFTSAHLGYFSPVVLFGTEREFENARQVMQVVGVGRTVCQLNCFSAPDLCTVGCLSIFFPNSVTAPQPHITHVMYRGHFSAVFEVGIR